MIEFTGVILAGGASRRMGSDKASLFISPGVTLLDRMMAVLHSVGAKEIAILGRPDLVEGYADKSPDTGPVNALADHLEAATPDSLHLVVPVDMPLLSADVLRTLIQAQNWAIYADHFFPLLAHGGPCIRPASQRLQDFLKDNGATALPLPDGTADIFLNVNTPDDMEMARLRLQT